MPYPSTELFPEEMTFPGTERIQKELRVSLQSLLPEADMEGLKPSMGMEDQTPSMEIDTLD